MAIATGITLIAVLLILLALGIEIGLGVYVWRDAGRRGMNRVLWTLVVVLVPYCIGIIIYLLARSNRGDYQCPKCGQTVELSYSRCPNCGATLRGNCPSCGNPVEPGWNLCPQCGAPLPQDGSVTPPVRRKDRLWLVLVLLLVVPVALVVLLALGVMGYRANLLGSDLDTSYSYSVSDGSFFSVFTSITEEGAQDCDEVARWLESTTADLAEGEIGILRFQTDEYAGGVLVSLGDRQPECVPCGADGDEVALNLYPADEDDSELTLYVFVYQPASRPWYLQAVDDDGDPTDEDVSASITVAADHQAVADFCLNITDLQSIFDGVTATEGTVDEVLTTEDTVDEVLAIEDSMFHSTFTSLSEEDVQDCDEVARWLESVEDELAQGEVCVLRFQTDTWAGGVLASVGDRSPCCYQDDAEDGSVALCLCPADEDDTELSLYVFVYQPASLSWYIQAVDSDGVPTEEDIPAAITAATDQQTLGDLCVDMTGAQDLSDILTVTETED